MAEKCSICGTAFEVDEDGNVYTEDEDDNPLVFYCDECDSDEENMLCKECITHFENADVDLCKKCLKVTEKIVEKIVEKPVYIDKEIGKSTQEGESMQDFEKRIMG